MTLSRCPTTRRCLTSTARNCLRNCVQAGRCQGVQQLCLKVLTARPFDYVSKARRPGVGQNVQIRRMIQVQGMARAVRMRCWAGFRFTSGGGRKSYWTFVMPWNSRGWLPRRFSARTAGRAPRGLPVGSGPAEAACKTIVKQRMCRSGMRWSRTGGQPILSIRAIVKPGRRDSFRQPAAAKQHQEMQIDAIAA